MIRLAQKADEAGLIALWEIAFGDERASIERFLHSELCTEKTALIWEEQGEVAGAVYLLDAGITRLASKTKLKTAYTYALATLPKFRGRGIAAALAKENVVRSFALGYDLHLLRPGEQSLFAYYENLGFHYHLTMHSGTVCKRENSPLALAAEVAAIDFPAYTILRDLHLPVNCTLYPRAYLEYALQVNGPKLALYRIQIGDTVACAFVEHLEDTLFLREVLPAKVAEEVAYVLMEHFEANTATFRTVAEDNGAKPFVLAMTKKPEQEDFTQVYFPFVLD